MAEKDKLDTKVCGKSVDGKHNWSVKLESPGNHGDKKMVEMFVCKECGSKKPIKQN
jgi:ribosomal protein L40E